MTIQRRRGEPVKIFKQINVKDRRGNDTLMWDEANPITLRAFIYSSRSSRAEVPGQQHINVKTMIFQLKPEDEDDVGLWSQVEYRGKRWDIVEPPGQHPGTRRTSHWTCDLRERP